MASAALRVFAIPELLETILQFLPERDLLLDQRVSTVWQATTTKSPALQQQLHYRDAVCDLDRHTFIEWTPLCISMTNDNASLPKDWFAPRCHSDASKGVLVKQSWNGMFVTRPAVSEIHVDFLAPIPWDDMWSGEHTLSGSVKNPNGVTVGQLRETEWIDKELERRCAKGISTHLQLSVCVYRSLCDGTPYRGVWFLIPRTLPSTDDERHGYRKT